jgi:membrane-bound lytic murein transglycosylase A
MRTAETGTPDPVDSRSLEGWPDPDPVSALVAFRQTADLLDEPIWADFAQRCAAAGDAARFLAEELRATETFEEVLFTGYHEPDLSASPVQTERFCWPVCRLPEVLPKGQIWHDRAEIETGSATRGLEIAWLDDPLELFLLQVQGSGRLRFPDGEILRVGFAGTNGHPYRSIGAELVRSGEVPAERMEIEAIRNWCRTNPERVANLLRHNPSYVFFRVLDLSPDAGPLGAMGRSVTALRTIAVDPSCIPLGTPVWVEVDGPIPFSRIMIAQDTGSAIKGPRRADIFFGFSPQASRLAGAMKSTGRVTMLLPRGPWQP